ncbi:MAG: restriction endonuclease [Bifidobacteriaceae bacterium]|jgi:hypothetical protein|nr:restriction endonuclease [Bifidobacteriaceae bacterium]
MSFKDEVKSYRTESLPTPKELVEWSFKSLGYHESDESYFATNASTIVTALREKSWKHYKRLEKEFSRVMIQSLHREKKQAVDEFIFDNIEELDWLFKSNTNSRRSRAGKEFELIIEKVLEGAEIPYDSQSSIGAGVFADAKLAKIVDVVIPNAIEYMDNKRGSVLISAKTTLRERWQEVGDEMSRTKASEMYLATVDEKISVNVIDKLTENNIYLVTTRDIKVKNYESEHRIITFEQMLQEIKDKLVKYGNSR